MILAIDTGGTFIKWAVTDNYEILKSGKLPTPYGTRDDYFAAVEEILSANREFPVKGIAFSFPGSIDPAKGLINHGGALQYMNGTDMSREIQERFHLPSSIENDACCAALAECEKGNLKDADSGLLIVIGTGVGSALVYHNEIIHGHFGAAGEMSLVLPDCMNTDNVFHNIGAVLGMRGFTERFRKELNDKTLTGETFMRKVKDNDRNAAQLFEEYMNTFAAMLFNIQTFFDPQRVLIGGGISADPLYIESIKEHQAELYGRFTFPLKHAEIMPCRFSSLANLIGALVNYYRIHP